MQKEQLIENSQWNNNVLFPGLGGGSNYSSRILELLLVFIPRILERYLAKSLLLSHAMIYLR